VGVYVRRRQARSRRGPVTEEIVPIGAISYKLAPPAVALGWRVAATSDARSGLGIGGEE